MSRTNRRILVFGVAIVGIAVLILPKLGLRDEKKDGSGSPGSRDQTVSVSYEIVHPEKVLQTIPAVGTLLPNEEVEIRSEITGKIESIHFKEGTRVNKGQLLVKINDSELQARLLSAQYRKEIAQQDENRQRELFAKSLTSEQDYNAVANALRIVQAEEQLIVAQIAKTEIRASFDGTIGLRSVSEGSVISPTTMIAVLQDNDPVKLDFAFPEKFARDVRIGDRVQFTVQGAAGRFHGTLYARSPGIDAATRTLNIRALCPNPDGKLIPGSFATVEVTLQEHEELMVPSYAVIPELKGHKVFILKNGRAEAKEVEIGTRTDERIGITAGLAAGDTLITSAILQLRPGLRVTPRLP